MVACKTGQSSVHAVFLPNASDHMYRFNVACSFAAMALILMQCSECACDTPKLLIRFSFAPC